ncbi:fad/fmn-containing dehydrogenase [hydrocarbon metagenome]|uniref:Fad/fmn-containing dehydrogenase n=1 Tax=hydrocarbon metagenome TaxID=938273 RepID=A0A0W8G9M3_9ZZZZ
MSPDAPAPLPPAARRFLTGLFPGDAAVFSPEETCVFGTDASRRHALPAAVVRPETEEQVRELLRFAHAERLPIHCRGRGTNTVGDCVPAPSGIVISTARFAEILEIAEDDFVAVCRPGLVTGDLQAALAEKRLFYPPDPASVRFSTLGGNVATCAGGMRALKYGVTRDFVLGIRAILPGGEAIDTGGRTHKNVTGLDLTRLLVGSEGTLAFFSEITVKLLPLPEATATALCAHADADAALAAAGDIFRAGMLPAAMEFVDRTCLAAVAACRPLPWGEQAGAALLVRLDGSEGALAADLARLEGIFAGRGPLFVRTAREKAEQETLWEVRTTLNQASFRVAPDKISDDVTVPRGAIRAAVARIQDVAAQERLPILVFGHVGDGNLHVNIMHHAADPDERGRALAAREEILGLTLALGGTLSGEHGVGLSKLPFLDRQIGPGERGLMRRIKAVFDPHGIMNPGKAY